MGITFSITVPEPLEKELNRCAKEEGLSRSRFICNILLKWREKESIPINTCIHQERGFCKHFGISCNAPQYEAETCSNYIETKRV